MKLYDLGKVSWQDTQTIYHALARLGREALSLVSPSSPYVCIGFHQDAEQEVDMGFCMERGIPVFRREVGGGAVYLDGDQLFFHLVLKKDNPVVPESKEAFYRKFLRPVINVYRHMGIQAEYKPVNDVVVENRKISGTGAAEIGECIVFVGNLIVDFNYGMMSRVLMVPDEKFRDKVHKTLKENLSTIRRELGGEEAAKWDEATLNRLMADEFSRILGPMEASEIGPPLREKMDELEGTMNTEEWLYQTRRKGAGRRQIKISAGAQLLHRVHKAQGGLMRADIEVIDGRFKNVYLSGDFFCFPEKGVEWIEEALQDRDVEEARNIVQDLYEERGIETPGIRLEDWMEVLEG
ncbi:MAG: lipoate--protein ligase family protein [Deltaproteobacteria bacterium]|nr:lipoate--protein ligase family protein [Deltaproteobacteria bacterium]